MSALEIGDAVLANGRKYSRVYSLGHWDASGEADYLQIFTGKDAPLEISWLLLPELSTLVIY